MRATIPAMILIMLTGCTMKTERDAKALVSAQLRDPASAQFDKLRIEGNGLLVCGNVNAKNGMGGYAGMTPFMVWQERVYLQETPSEFDVASCCQAIAAAVKNEMDSDHAPGFKSCGDYIAEFSWGKHS